MKQLVKDKMAPILAEERRKAEERKPTGEGGGNKWALEVEKIKERVKNRPLLFEQAVRTRLKQKTVAMINQRLREQNLDDMLEEIEVPMTKGRS
mmetsp:Transcript_45269/g.106847  ORF Transcript_45269/g.106847 Transcript_45269/m.106847 type:complete len:94 (-) Transcript_45269:355-636(-)